MIRPVVGENSIRHEVMAISDWSRLGFGVRFRLSVVAAYRCGHVFPVDEVLAPRDRLLNSSARESDEDRKIATLR